MRGPQQASWQNQCLFMRLHPLVEVVVVVEQPDLVSTTFPANPFPAKRGIVIPSKLACLAAS
jgi:hypothetical protein